MSGIKIRVIDNREYFLRGKNEATQKILREVGERAAEHAKELVPSPDRNSKYATGALQESIDYDIIEKAVRIYAAKDYAAYVELGTRYQTAQPYLRPAMEDYQDEYRSIAESLYRGDGAKPGKKIITYIHND